VNRPLYLAAALVLLVAWLPVAAVCVRARAIDGLVALETAGALTTLVLICLAVGLHQSSFGTLSLIAAVCVMISGLVFARFMDRRP
jgi:multisubunit Na+/H+ antiporter MnhF subunit